MTDGPDAKRGRGVPRRPPGRHPLFHTLTLALSALALFAAGSVWLLLFPPVPRDLDGAPDLDAQARRVSIPVGGERLNGYVLAGRRPDLVVVFHGYGRDHTRAWRYAQFLNRAGYGVVTVDFRSSRQNQRKPTTLGTFELEDAEATLAWIAREPGLRRSRVALFGESLGASVALVLAARHPEVVAVVADCPFASGRRALEDTIHHWFLVPGEPAATIASSVARITTGHDPDALDVMGAAAALRGRPVFFIHAARDDRMRPEQAEDLWRAAGGKDSLWLTADGHNEGWQKQRPEYERRVLAFYRVAFGAPPA